jgi:carbon storage regulator
MLVLCRKVGERVVIPQLGITVTILEIRGQQVRLGIAAPAEVGVYRREVWQRLRRAPTTEEAEVPVGRPG